MLHPQSTFKAFVSKKTIIQTAEVLEEAVPTGRAGLSQGKFTDTGLTAEEPA